MHDIQSPAPVTDESIEAEIKRKGLSAPRVTPADIEAAIRHEHYFTAEEGVNGMNDALRNYAPSDLRITDDSLKLLTFCVLVLKNGFTVTGESACASPANFDADLGRKIARENAKQKIWSLLGYALKDKLHGIANAMPPEPTEFADASAATTAS